MEREHAGEVVGIVTGTIISGIIFFILLVEGIIYNVKVALLGDPNNELIITQIFFYSIQIILAIICAYIGGRIGRRIAKI